MKINHSNIHTIEIGSGEPTLLWTHGLIGCAQGELAGYIPLEILGQNMRVIVYDANNHGDSDDDISLEHHTFDALADTMLSIMDELNLGKCFLGGSAKGAAIALCAASKAPDRVSGLFLNTLPDSWQHKKHNIESYRNIINNIQEYGTSIFCDQLARSPLPLCLTGLESKKSIDIKKLESHPKESILAILEGAIQSDLPSVEMLSKLKMPIILLSLHHLPGHGLETADTFIKAVPQTKHIIMEHHEEISDHIQIFLDFFITDKN